MKFLALRWQVNGVEHCLVDSVNPGNVEERHIFFRTSFPENNARLEMVEIPDSRLADTLVPPALDTCACGQPADPRWFKNGKPACDGCGEAPDPFATEALELVGRQAMPTMPETLVERDRRDNRELGRLVGKERT